MHLILKNKIIITFGEVKVPFFPFKQLPLNMKQKIEFWYHLIDGERVLLIVVPVVSCSADKPLDFHDTTFQYHLIFLRYNKVVGDAVV